MSNDTVVSLAAPAPVPDPLTELLRSGARRLVEAAVRAEFEEHLSAFGHEKLPDGRQRVVRLGEVVPTALGEPVQVSLGVAPSILLAKLAAESDKPRSRRVLHGTDEEPAAFPVSDLAGVGPTMTAKLLKNGICTLADLHRLGPASARALWGGGMDGTCGWSSTGWISLRSPPASSR